MKRLRAWLGVLLVFLLGAVCGGVFATSVLQHHVRALLTGGSAKVEDPIVGKLRRALKLDAAQEAQVRKIVSDARRQLESIKQKTQPETRAVMTDGEQKVRALLRPEQAQHFDQLLRESQEKWRGGP